MYLSANAVLSAIQILRTEVHPFIGIVFVALKGRGLPIGSSEEISMGALMRAHMEEHHRIDRRSGFYFQPFNSNTNWVESEKYPSGGLQTIYTQSFGSVFIHEHRRKDWGFKHDYLDRIDQILKRSQALPVPADALAIWLYKDAELGSIGNYDELVERFFEDYQISDEERSRVFSAKSMADQLPLESAFVTEPLEMTAVLRQLPNPPDAAAEGGRTITSLHLLNAGPASEMQINFGPRLSIVTGDNGLGKSFLLDFTWWAATGMWADREALPSQSAKKSTPRIEYTLTTLSDRLSTFTAIFDEKSFSWVRPNDAMTVEALAVFSRADGSFAVADPVRTKFHGSNPATSRLTAREVWSGSSILEGLIRDWIRWQTAADRKTFDQFASVLKRLSPEDLGPLTPGPPVRLRGHSAEIPTIQHLYATVPVTHASAGIQRVLLLAYLIIWSWQEHEFAAQQLGQAPLRRMMVVVDELEAHLHPKWQRIVLPALMGVGDILSSDLAIQTIAATHSPMILASMEPTFDSSTDVLYHLYGDGPTVKLEETQFIKYGDVSGWLTSPLFGLRHARSREAEAAIEAAKLLQLAAEPTAQEVEAVSSELKRHLSSDDKFWPRWLFFAERHGVKI